MQLSKRDKGLLLGLAGILLIAAVYFLLFSPLGTKKEALKAELATLKAREAELVKLEADMEFYQNEIIRLEGEKNQLAARFPADIKEESEIMYAVELEDNVDVQFTSLNYGTESMIFGTEEDPEGSLKGYLLPMTMAYKASYEGLKETILHTNDHANRMVIDQLTATYDAVTGELNGNMTLNMYYMEGTGNAYVKPYVPAMGMGVSNIFGTID